MSDLLYRLFSDSETLHDYESRGLEYVKVSDLLRRLVAMERVEDGGQRTDAYYDGKGKLELKDYQTINDLMIVFPRRLACEFLIRKKDVLYVKEEKFEEWSKLKTKLSPLWILAGFISSDLSSDIVNSRSLWEKFRVKEIRQFKHTALLLPYIPDLDYFVKQTGGLNDLHIHLNGSTEADVIWRYMLSHPYLIVDDYNKAFYSNARLRKHAEQVSVGFSPELLLKRLLKAIELRNVLIEFLYNHYPVINTLGYDIGDELLLYILLIKHLSIHHNERVVRCFHYYMLIKGLIQSFVVMQNNQVGFSQFQLITDNTFRHRLESYYKERFLQLASGCSLKYIRLIEGRFSPQMTVGENYNLVNRIKKGFDKACIESKGLLDDTSLTLIAHFIKRPEKESEKGHFVRNYYLRKELREKAICLMMMVKDHPKCGQLIRGVDAAASEFDARPEVFAPTFAFLRESGIDHFTYHVGEDFCHLLSGLRAVYEAMSFLQLQSGDRLGHCTALGIPPELWNEKTGGYCYLSRGEWLDDLVFVWNLVKSGLIEIPQSVMFAIEGEITELAEVIYNNVYLPYELAEAWLLRKYVPYEDLNAYYPKYSHDYFQHNRVYRKYMNDGNKKRITKLWQLYHEAQRYTQDTKGNRIPTGCRSRYDEVIRIASNELLGVNELLRIQSVVLDLISQKNIVIEALPSSNLRISLYDHLQDYHLKHWLNEEKNDRLLPTVVLGSDDPGIFMTNIYNEYALAYVHLKLNKYAPSKRLEIIRSIHEQSEIYCFNDGRL